MSVDEIIVVDSGSTDGTSEILQTFENVRVIPMLPESFNHGDARNIGVMAARSEWVVLTVGDATPADANWIEKLFAGVLDKEVVAVCGSQIVPDETTANPMEWFRPVSPPAIRRVQFDDPADFDRLAPSEKLEVCGWDDVTALYLRRILLEIPFRHVVYGEDALWARDALRAGHALVFNPEARVKHYHLVDADFTLRRTIQTLCFRYRTFDYVYEPESVTLRMLHVVKRLASERRLTLRERWKWVVYNWTISRSIRAAVRTFDSRRRDGGQSLNSLCHSYSDRPPTPDKSGASHFTSLSRER